MSWESLPLELLTDIFSRVEFEDLILGPSLACRSWHRASLDPFLWRNLDLRESFWLHELLDLAVSRSGDMVQSIYFPLLYCVYDADLVFVAKRCRNLKFVYLCTAYKISAKAFCEAISQWKQLGGMEVDVRCLKPAILRQISSTCKNFNHLGAIGVLSLEVAQDIVCWLPNLRSINLSNTNCQKTALITILNGCKYLEVLDITRCGCVGRDSEVQQLAKKLKFFRYDKEHFYICRCPECHCDYDCDYIFS